MAQREKDVNSSSFLVFWYQGSKSRPHTCKAGCWAKSPACEFFLLWDWSSSKLQTAKTIGTRMRFYKHLFIFFDSKPCWHFKRPKGEYRILFLKDVMVQFEEETCRKLNCLWVFTLSSLLHRANCWNFEFSLYSAWIAFVLPCPFLLHLE